MPVMARHRPYLFMYKEDGPYIFVVINLILSDPRNNMFNLKPRVMIERKKKKKGTNNL